MADNDPDSVHDRAFMYREERRALAQAQEKAEREAGERAAADDGVMIGRLLGTWEGKRFLSQLLEECGVLQPSFVGGAEGADRATAYQEGKRAVGIRQIEKLRAVNPRALIEIQEFAIEEQTKEGAKA
jgi:hypothetical protein